MIVRQLSGGYSPEIEIELIDGEGNDLSALTFKTIIVPVGDELGEITDPGWRTPDSASFPAVGQAILKWDYTSGNAVVGDHWLHLLTPDNEAHRVTLIRFD